jgi:hypothetical protein
MRRLRTVSLALAALVVLLSPVPSHAEWFFDLYAGVAMTEERTARAEVPSLGLSVRARTDPDPTSVFGGRIGYWFGMLPWLGLAVDASYFEPGDDLSVVPLSGLVMLRLPLFRSASLPAGRLQPYVAAGPAAFFSLVDVRENGEDVDAASTDVGLDARAGLTVMLARNIGLFAEYRYTSFEPSFDLTLQSIDASVNAKIPTHHIVGTVLCGVYSGGTLGSSASPRGRALPIHAELS